MNSEPVEEFTGESIAELEGVLEIFTESPPLISSLLIFVNNTFTTLQMLFLGVVLGVSPLLTLLFNGAILGGLLGMVAVEESLGEAFFMFTVGILPHGIPELFAVFIGSALGLKLGYHSILSPLTGKTRLESFLHIWQEIISVLPFIIVLLLLAAFIEVFFTMNLLEFLNPG